MLLKQKLQKFAIVKFLLTFEVYITKIIESQIYVNSFLIFLFCISSF